MAWNDLNKGQKKQYQVAFSQLYGNVVAHPLPDEAFVLKPEIVKAPRGCPTEESEHIRCAYWLRSKNIFFHHSPNGEKRSLHVGAKLKRMGVRAGWPDFEFPCPSPNNRYHGLFIELKALDGHLSAVQHEVLNHLSNKGYKAICVYGFDELKKAVEDYFNLSN